MTVEEALEQLKAAILEAHAAAMASDQADAAQLGAYKRAEKAGHDLRRAELTFRCVVSGLNVPEF